MRIKIFDITVLALLTVSVAGGAVLVDWGHVIAGWMATTILLVLCFAAIRFEVTFRSATVETPWSMWMATELFVYATHGFSIAFVAAVGAMLVSDRARCKSFGIMVCNASLVAVPMLCMDLACRWSGGLVAPLDLPADYIVIIATTIALAGSYLLWVPLVFAATERSRPVRVVLNEVVVGMNPVSTVLEALIGAAAAVVYLLDPWAILVVIPLGASLMMAVRRQAKIEAVTEAALESFAQLVDERDRYTAEHSTRVCEYSMKIGEAMGLSPKKLGVLYWTSRLHDLGKISLDDAVLNKEGKLTDEEFEEMKTHPEVSARILRSFSFNDYDADVVLCHHERFDGRGYMRRTADTVPLESFIIAVADTFDAMTSDRPYRKALPRDVAFAEIYRGIGTQFEPRAAEAFLAAMGFEMPETGSAREEQVKELRHHELGSASVDWLGHTVLTGMSGRPEAPSNDSAQPGEARDDGHGMEDAA